MYSFHVQEGSTITFQNQTYSLYSDEKKYVTILEILVRTENLELQMYQFCNKDKGGSLVLGGLSTRQSSLRGCPTFFATCSGGNKYSSIEKIVTMDGKIDINKLMKPFFLILSIT